MASDSMTGKSVRPGLLQQVRATLSLAVPVMIARCGFVIMVAVDTAMTGQVSKETLAHYSIAMAPHLPLMVIGIGMMVATTILAAQARGAGRNGDIGAIWRGAMLIAVAMGLIGFVVLGFGESILSLMGQSGTLAYEGGRTLQAFAYGMPAMFLFLACNNVLEGLGRPKIGMVITLSANLINAGANWLLIEGHWGFPALGGAGAAYSTTLARWYMFLAVLIYMLVLMRDRDDFALLGWSLPFSVTKKQLRLGLPLAGSVGLQNSAQSALLTFAGWMGALPLAAFQISNNVTAFVFMLSLGLATATSIRVAQAVGRGDAVGRADAGWLGLGLALLLQLCVGAALAIFTGAVLSIFTGEAELLTVTASSFFLVSLIVVADAGHTVMQGALRASGEVMKPLLTYLVVFWFLLVPLGYWFGYRQGWGVEGLLGAMLIGYALAAVILALLFRASTRRDIRPV